MTCLDKQGHPKKTYQNKTSAERAKTERVRQNPTLDLRVYRCDACGLFHLSHVVDKFPRRKDEEAA
jgi:ribosomal protein L32